MRAIIVLVATICLLHAPIEGVADVHVRGYFRKNGTYVKPHYRSYPNATRLDNWSTKGNVNPHTGKRGTSNPDLERKAVGNAFDGLPYYSSLRPVRSRARLKPKRHTLGKKPNWVALKADLQRSLVYLRKQADWAPQMELPMMAYQACVAEGLIAAMQSRCKTGACVSQLKPKDVGLDALESGCRSVLDSSTVKRWMAIPDIVATVDGNKIHFRDVQAILLEENIGDEVKGLSLAAFKGALSTRILLELAQLEAARRGIGVADEELGLALLSVIQQRGGNKATFLDFLAQIDRTPQEFAHDTRLRIVSKRLLNSKKSPDMRHLAETAEIRTWE
jgi:hypothetical protein